MDKKTNKEALGVVGVENVMALYEKLSPWEQRDFADKFGTDFSDMSGEQILDHFNMNPIDYVDERDVRDAFGDVILGEYATYEIYDELDRRLWEIDASDIIYMLEEKARGETNRRRCFTREDIDRLESLILELKEKLNNEDKNS